MNSIGARRWWALAALDLGVLAVGLDVTVLSVALPTLAVSLHASATDLQWFISSYTLALAVALLPGGLLGDRFGRKKVMIGALSVFGLGSLACAYAPNAGAFIAARTVLGLAAGCMIPLVLSGASPETKERAQRWNDTVKRLARLADISFADRPPEGAVQLLVRGEVVALPLKGVINLSAEKARLDKEIVKADADIKRVDAKLGNEKFVTNAPEEIVEEEKEKREAAVARKAKLQEALERLKMAS